MSNEELTREREIAVDEASLVDAYLAIPDSANVAIADARKTFVVVAISTVLFAAAVIFFIL